MSYNPLKPRELAVQAIHEFLRDNDMHETLAALNMEALTHLQIDIPKLREKQNSICNAVFRTPNALEKAMALLEENRDKESKKGCVDRSIDSNVKILVDAEDKVIKRCVDTISGVHDKNIITTCFSPSANTDNPYGALLASGGVDKSLCISQLVTSPVSAASSSSSSSPAQLQYEKPMYRFENILNSPILAMDWNPVRHSLLSVSCMSGSHALIDLDLVDCKLHANSTHDAKHSDDAATSSLSSSLSSMSLNSPVVKVFSDHSKYVVMTKWSPDGHHFATASHDCSLRIYGYRNVDDVADNTHDTKNDSTTGAFVGSNNDNDNDNGIGNGNGNGNSNDGKSDDGKTWKCVQEIRCKGYVEALEFVNAETLVVSIRDDNCLHIIDIPTMRERSLLNMNALGDTHVSFAALDVSVSPDNGSFLLVSTDKHRMIMFEADRSHKQVRNFYGMKNDAYGTPRNCWSSHGSHVYSTSQDNSVYGWDIGTEKVVSVMKGHTSMVRDLVSHRDSDFNMLATASYDKTVRLWGV